MRKNSTLWVSAGLFLTVYILLLLPATGANRQYCKYFCLLGNFLYEDFSGGGFVRLSPQEGKGKNDISLFLSKSEWKKEGKLTGVTTDKASDRIGFLFTAFFIALTLATPVSWKRKLPALLIGLAIITAFVMLKLRIIILYAFTQATWFGLYQDESVKQCIEWWYVNIAATATMGYSLAVILWLAIVIGKTGLAEAGKLAGRKPVVRQNT